VPFAASGAEVISNIVVRDFPDGFVPTRGQFPTRVSESRRSSRM
jgi:hypothetical protein